jgi:hypothetical protein
MSGLFPDLDGHWLAVKDADPRAVSLYRRHYSNKLKSRIQRAGIGGCGPRLVLLTPDCQALFIWRGRLMGTPTQYDDGQRGVMCSVFRNEGPVRSSDLIREAVDIAWARWPGERLFTYVWDAKVATSTQRGRARAGWCFRKAGWSPCGRNADGRLTILEILPAEPIEYCPLQGHTKRPEPVVS